MSLAYGERVLDGRVAVITGAGRGLGREHALLMAAEGACVVVNDVGGDMTGSGSDPAPAERVAAEIRALGGRAVANTDDISDWTGAKRLIDMALDAYGELDVLVNNAGILRDRTLANMTEAEWDSVIAVHLKGHAACTRWAVDHWRRQVKQGHAVNASVINTTSIAGLLGNRGQTNYGAAKAAIAAFTLIAAMETINYGVRVNAIAPIARTRLTTATPGLEGIVHSSDDSGFDGNDPANVSPLVAYLATAGCPVTGAVFHVGGEEVGLFSGWELVSTLQTDGRWTIGELENAIPSLCAGRLEMPSSQTGPGSFHEILERMVQS